MKVIKMNRFGGNIVVCGLLLAFSVVFSSCSSSTADPFTDGSIKVGMSEGEVKTLLGEPTRIGEYKTATYGPNATEAEKRAFLESLTTRSYEYDGQGYIYFGQDFKVKSIEAAKE